MKYFQKLYLVILGLFMLGTAYAGTVVNTNTTAPQTSTNAPTQKVQDDTEYLFIETAKIGHMKKDPNAENTYAITLTEVDPWITYFSNVPKRITGFMHMKDFLQLLASETQTKYKAGLNSGLIALTQPNDKMARYILSIKDPKYNMQTQTITFTAHIVPGAQKNSIPDNVDLQHVSLFIDAVCASCGATGF
jgi:hypothetical protein